jgi:hypothetical protein
MLRLLIQDAIERFLTTIEPLRTYDSIPSVLNNTGLALLTILIPLAIAILQEVYQKKKNKGEDFAELDLQTILDAVFRIKRLIMLTTLTFLPFLFWEMTREFASLRLLEIIASLVGICYMIKIILNFYGWTKGNVMAFRKTYLSGLKSVPEIINAWASVWKSKMDIQTEMEFHKIFSSKIDEAVNKYEKRHRYHNKTPF